MQAMRRVVGMNLAPSMHGRVGKLREVPHAMHHREHKLLDLLGLDFCFGEELGRAKTQFRHFAIGDFATRVNDQRERARLRSLAQPFDQGKIHRRRGG